MGGRRGGLGLRRAQRILPSCTHTPIHAVLGKGQDGADLPLVFTWEGAAGLQASAACVEQSEESEGREGQSRRGRGARAGGAGRCKSWRVKDGCPRFKAAEGSGGGCVLGLEAFCGPSTALSLMPCLAGNSQSGDSIKARDRGAQSKTQTVLGL